MICERNVSSTSLYIVLNVLKEIHQQQSQTQLIQIGGRRIYSFLLGKSADFLELIKVAGYMSGNMTVVIWTWLRNNVILRMFPLALYCFMFIVLAMLAVLIPTPNLFFHSNRHNWFAMLVTLKDHISFATFTIKDCSTSGST